jgi:hypothetical protein
VVLSRGAELKSDWRTIQIGFPLRVTVLQSTEFLVHHSSVPRLTNSKVPMALWVQQLACQCKTLTALGYKQGSPMAAA